MTLIVDLSITIVQIFLLLLVLRAVLSWFPGRGGAVERFARSLTDPVLRPLQRILPSPNVGGVAIDLSFVAVFLLTQLFILPLLSSLR
jgi:YggT family protein